MMTSMPQKNKHRTEWLNKHWGEMVIIIMILMMRMIRSWSKKLIRGQSGMLRHVHTTLPPFVFHLAIIVIIVIVINNIIINIVIIVINNIAIIVIVIIINNIIFIIIVKIITIIIEMYIYVH